MLDATLASMMLVGLSPLILLVAIAVRVEDRGPVIYSQWRWGRDGSKFRLYKFRSMAYSSSSVPITQALQDDRRITKVGRLLRATGIDELPQLVNILRGDMSFVGPRALAVGELVRDANGDLVRYEDVPGFQERLLVRPGLTGPATIFAPKDVSPLTKFKYDLDYIENQSLATDLRLIGMSFGISFRGRWESRGDKLH